MWLSKPVYESLPFYYFGIGLAALFAASYIDYGYWSIALTAFGIVSMVGGLAIWLKRRDYRSSRSRIDFEKTQ
jgi:hypothetical protein